MMMCANISKTLFLVMSLCITCSPHNPNTLTKRAADLSTTTLTDLVDEQENPKVTEDNLAADLAVGDILMQPNLLELSLIEGNYVICEVLDFYYQFLKKRSDWCSEAIDMIDHKSKSYNKQQSLNNTIKHLPNWIFEDISILLSAGTSFEKAATFLEEKIKIKLENNNKSVPIQKSYLRIGNEFQIVALLHLQLCYAYLELLNTIENTENTNEDNILITWAKSNLEDLKTSLNHITKNCEPAEILYKCNLSFEILISDAE